MEHTEGIEALKTIFLVMGICFTVVYVLGKYEAYVRRKQCKLEQIKRRKLGWQQQL